MATPKTISRANKPAPPAEVGLLVTRAGAALRIWTAAVRLEPDAIGAAAAAPLQTALGLVIEALTGACDAEASDSGASFLPLHRTRDLLCLADRVLWAVQGGDAVALARADLLGAAELAAATLEQFDVGSLTARVITAKAPAAGALDLATNDGPGTIH